MHSERPSFTSMVVAAMRAVYGEFPSPVGGDPDPLARHVLPVPFLVPANLAARAKASPERQLRMHRAYGSISAGMTYHVALRTRAIDDALRQALAQGTTQIVLLGAGLDGRAYRMPELAGLQVFEVDHPSTQRDKQARLAKAHLQSQANVVFVPVDFEHDALDVSLEKAGFLRHVPSFWIWEGVTVYLTRDAVEATLQAVAKLSAPGSRLAMTYARPPSKSADPNKPLMYRGMRALIHAGSKVLGQLGESVRNFMDSDAMTDLITRAGFALVSDENAADWTLRYWPGQIPASFEWERLAVIERRTA